MNFRSSCAVVIATSSLIIVACKESPKERPLPEPLSDPGPQQRAPVDPTKTRPAAYQERTPQADNVQEKAKTRPAHDGGSGTKSPSAGTAAPEATGTSTGAAQADPAATAAPRTAAPPGTEESPAPAAPAAAQPTE
jgi:hypothetical protein